MEKLFRALRTRGYTFVALVVGIAVMMVLIAAVLPLASTEAQRDKEDELIFRGFQYAEGIRLFRRRYGRFPNTLKEMYEMRPRTLRHLWKDPITNSMNWGLVSVLTGAPSTLSGGRNPMPPGAPTPTPVPTAAPTPGFGAPPDTSAGPIAGVYSKSKKKGFRQFNGRDTYDQWQFTEQTLMNQSPTSSSPCVQSGKPGPGC